jgi:drug/metabolite transporter (DMT)-like permease
MVAFAGNSLLCRLALGDGTIDPAQFTFWRILSGAMTLFILVKIKGNAEPGKGNMTSAFALFIYAAGFSFAYVSLSTGAGALLLFGAVQITMIGWGLYRGERFTPLQWLGFAAAIGGLVILMLPSASAPDLFSALLMMAAGVAWGVYSIRGKGKGSPTRVTAGNFLLSVPLAIILLFIFTPDTLANTNGLMLAVASGALASGLGYALWYSVLPHISSTNAATMQLTVPVFAMFAGWLFLAEPISGLMMIATLAVLGGVYAVIWGAKARHG